MLSVQTMFFWHKLPEIEKPNSHKPLLILIDLVSISTLRQNALLLLGLSDMQLSRADASDLPHRFLATCWCWLPAGCDWWFVSFILGQKQWSCL